MRQILYCVQNSVIVDLMILNAVDHMKWTSIQIDETTIEMNCDDDEGFDD